jgi:hypothetical protein
MKGVPMRQASSARGKSGCAQRRGSTSASGVGIPLVITVLPVLKDVAHLIEPGLNALHRLAQMRPVLPQRIDPRRRLPICVREVDGPLDVGELCLSFAELLLERASAAWVELVVALPGPASHGGGVADVGQEARERILAADRGCGPWRR